MTENSAHRHVHFTIEPLYDGQVVFAEVRGDLYPEDVTHIYTEILQHANQHNTTRVLVNFVQTQLDYETVKILDLIEQLKVIAEGYVIARIVDAQDFRQYVVEDYAQKVGLQLVNFSEHQAAIDWLFEQVP